MDVKCSPSHCSKLPMVGSLTGDINSVEAINVECYQSTCQRLVPPYFNGFPLIHIVQLPFSFYSFLRFFHGTNHRILLLIYTIHQGHAATAVCIVNILNRQLVLSLIFNFSCIFLAIVNFRILAVDFLFHCHESSRVEIPQIFRAKSRSFGDLKFFSVDP